MTATESFNYDNSLTLGISSINPNTASPVTKGTITVVGTNFGTDKSKVKVWLVDKTTNEEKYELNVNTITDTQL